MRNDLTVSLQLMHPILDSLDGTPHEWIKKLLFTFNEGNIGKFEALAPLFPKEVCFEDTLRVSMGYSHLLAYFARKLRIPAPEDLSDGAHRGRIQASFEYADDVVPDDR